MNDADRQALAAYVFKGLDEDYDAIRMRYEWIMRDIETYEFKILVMVAVLKENNVAFDGTIDNMCEWLGVSKIRKNKDKIELALNSLQSKGLILQTVKKNRRIVYITQDGMVDDIVVKVRKEWIAAFKRYNRDDNGKVINANRSVDWINTLKVFIFICGYPLTAEGSLFEGETVYTNALIATKLNIPERTVKRAIKALIECETPLLKIERHMMKYKTLNNEWRNIGSRFDLGVKF